MKIQKMLVVMAMLMTATKSYALGASACSLVTTAEIEKVTGTKFEKTEKPYLYNFPGGGSSCTYAHSQIQLVVYSGAGSEKKYEEYVRSNYAKMVQHGAPDMTKHPVSGVGGSAYFMSPRMPSAILVVHKGLNTFAVQMVAHNNNPESLKPTLIALAKIAATRVGLL
jgi:hypothetical protein